MRINMNTHWKRSISLALLLTLRFVHDASAEHHMSRPPLHWVNKRNSNVPLRITNNCEQDIYPAIQTQAGTGPPTTGFRLTPSSSNPQSVSADWQGRVWGRTNCSFNAQGTAPANNAPGSACSTGDCGGTVICRGSGHPPASLAEFTLSTPSQQTFYDISLVDGYNLPLGIISLLGTTNNSTLTDIPPNLTNPICIATVTLLGPTGSLTDSTFGTNATYPLPLEQTLTSSAVQSWCPWDLQLSPPQKPGDGVYPYPDDNIARPLFNPCYSACAKWASPQYCCTGKYNDPGACRPSLYSTQAKKVCPDAYSYAFDDQKSTFIIPSGGGFEVVFCPRGRSTIILNTLRDELNQLAQSGRVSQSILDAAQGVAKRSLEMKEERERREREREGKRWFRRWM
jgi:beta-mannosidase